MGPASIETFARANGANGESDRAIGPLQKLLSIPHVEINLMQRRRFVYRLTFSSPPLARCFSQLMRLLREILVRKHFHDARNRPTDATVRIDSWVVASYQ
jgi:hypothetical protein